MDRFLLVSALSLSGLGLLGLVLAGIVSIPAALVTLAALLLSPLRRRWGWTLSQRRFLYLLPVILAVLLADRLFLSPPLTWLMHLTLFLLAVKFWAPLFERDLLQVFTISFIHMTASAAVAQDVAFGLLLFLYTSIAVWAFIAFNCARDLRLAQAEKGVSMDQSPVLRDTPFRPLTHLPFVLVASFSLLLLLSLTGFFFVIIPRAGLPAILRNARWQDLHSGFSDRVELGSIGRIKLEDDVVMRAVLPDGANGLAMARGILWKGVALDRFDGTRWFRSRTLIDRTIYRWAETDRVMWGSVQASPRGLVRQQIILNPIATPYLFGLSDVLGVSPRSSSIDRLLYTPADRTWSLDYPPTERLLYDVYSAPDGSPWKRRVSFLEQARMGGHLSRIYLQIPDSLQPDLASLALEWTAGAASNRERADAILRRLRRDFEYSLEVGDLGEPLSLTDFLFRVRRGHCEYYATAMALLLRAVGIPSRVVTGFLPGEWNSTGGYFIVRQRDAHSWVEAFLPEEGWVTYDATPPDTGFPLIRTGIVAGIQKLIDSIDLRWSRYVLSFQLQDQLGILRRIRGAVSWTTDLVGRPLRAVRAPRAPGGAGAEGEILILAAVALVALALIARHLRARDIARPEWRRRWRRLRLTRAQIGLARDYLDLVRFCEKHSRPKHQSDTYLEFARELEASSPRFTGLREATQLYYRGRFAVSGNGRADRERLRAIARAIRRRTPRRKRRARATGPSTGLTQ